MWSNIIYEADEQHKDLKGVLIKDIIKEMNATLDKFHDTVEKSKQQRLDIK